AEAADRLTARWPAGTAAYQRWYAGWPGFTATNTPDDVAQTLPSARSSASTVARSPESSTGCAVISISPSVGVGRLSLMLYSAVTVHGGASLRACFMRWNAAVQFEWQSISVPMIPPDRVPSYASWNFWARH